MILTLPKTRKKAARRGKGPAVLLPFKSPEPDHDELPDVNIKFTFVVPSAGTYLMSADHWDDFRTPRATLERIG